METRICSVSECEELHHAKGFCNRHYKKWKRGKLNSYNDFTTEPGNNPRSAKSADKCRVRGCLDRGLRAGYCEIHYNRYEMLKAFARPASRIYFEAGVFDSLDTIEEDDSEHISGQISGFFSPYDQ